MNEPQGTPSVLAPRGLPDDVNAEDAMDRPAPEPWPVEDPAHAAARDARLAELSEQFPNQRVAYRDEWDGTQLVEPFVLAVSADYAVIHDAVRALPREQADRVVIHYLWPVGVARVTPYWIIYDENGNPRQSRRPGE